MARPTDASQHRSSVLQGSVRQLSLITVGHLKMEERERLLFGPPDQIEDEPARFFALAVGRRLNEQHVSGSNHHFADDLLAPDELNNEVPVGILTEVPMDLLVIVQVRFGGSCAQDAIRMVLQPSPELLQSKGRSSIHGHAHRILQSHLNPLSGLSASVYLPAERLVTLIGMGSGEKQASVFTSPRLLPS